MLDPEPVFSPQEKERIPSWLIVLGILIGAAGASLTILTFLGGH